MIVPRVRGDRYVVIEVNEMPDLTVHEPYGSLEKFVDFIFPQSIGRSKEKQSGIHGKD